LPDDAPFNGSALSELRLGNFGEVDDCAIDGEADSTAMTMGTRQCRIMPVFYRGRREDAT